MRLCGCLSTSHLLCSPDTSSFPLPSWTTRLRFCLSWSRKKKPLLHISFFWKIILDPGETPSMSIVPRQGSASYVTDFVPNKEFSTQKAAENSDSNLERHRQPSYLRESDLSTLTFVVACGSTAILVYIPSLFQQTSAKETCLRKFPVC